MPFRRFRETNARPSHHVTVTRPPAEGEVSNTRLPRGVASHAPAMAAADSQDDTSVPGTIQLVDLDGGVHGRHASSQSDIVLIPQPSTHPSDPLNWTRPRKLLSASCMCIYTFFIVVSAAANASSYATISARTELDLAAQVEGVGYLFLLEGWGCLVFQPLAMQYGKRPVYVFTMLATCAIMVWVPYSTVGKGQYEATRVLQGFVGAPVESLCEISVTDVYFQHERGFYIAWYGVALIVGGLGGPLIGGFIADGQGWEWIYHWCAIFTGATTVFLFFFMEETNYPRGGSSSSLLKHSSAFDPSLSDRRSPEPGTEAEKERSVSGDAGSVEDRTAHKPKSYWSKLKFFQKSCLEQPNRLLGMIWRPLVFLTFPVIFWAGISYGSAIVWFNLLQGTASLVLTEAPYHFRLSSVGLSFLSPIIGTLMAALYTGWFGDSFVLWLARRRHGVLEPEYRLWLFVPSLFLVPFGCILWGVGAAHEIHWFGLVFALGILGAINSIGLQLSVSYCLESYRALGSEALVSVILIRNTMSFAVNYGITPWVKDMGLQNAFLVAAFVGLAETATFLILVLGDVGKKLRRRSRERYLKYLAGMREAGMAY